MLDYDIVVNKFEFQSFFYVQFWTNTLGKGIVKLATVVKGDPKAPFLIATTPKCRGGHYSFPWIAPHYP